MRRFLAFLRALFLMTLRNRQALVWSFLFPILIMGFMGFVGSGASPIRVAVVGPAGPVRSMLAAALGKAPGVHLEKFSGGAAAARKSIHADHLDAAILLSPALDQRLAASLQGGPPAAVPVLYASSNYIEAQITRGVLAGILQATALAATHRHLPFYARTVAVGARRLTYLDFVVPGVVGMMIMNSALFAITGILTRWRERGILRRLRATGISPGMILSSLIINQAAIALVGVVLLLAVAMSVFHVHLAIDVPVLLPLSLLGIGAFLAVGLLLSGFAKTSEAVAPLTNLVTLPMMFLSGVFFPVSGLPDGLRQVVSLLPLTYLVDGLRGSMLGTAAAAAIRTDIWALLVWIAVAAIAASRSFRWEQ